MLKVGKYRCVGGKHVLEETSNGNVQFVLKASVIGEYDDNTNELYEIAPPVSRTIYMVINENTIDFQLAALRELGYSHGTFVRLDPEQKDAHSFEGVEFDGWCAHKPDLQGTPRERWSVSRPRDLTPKKEVDKKKLRSLDDLFGANLRSTAPRQRNTPASASVPNSAPAPAAGPATATVDDDDVPF